MRKLTSREFNVPAEIFCWKKEKVLIEREKKKEVDGLTHLKTIRYQPELLLTLGIPYNFHATDKLQFTGSAWQVAKVIWRIGCIDIPGEELDRIQGDTVEIRATVHGRGSTFTPAPAQQLELIRLCIAAIRPILTSIQNTQGHRVLTDAGHGMEIEITFVIGHGKDAVH